MYHFYGMGKGMGKGVPVPATMSRYEGAFKGGGVQGVQ